jgi:hypothetical protein
MARTESQWQDKDGHVESIWPEGRDVLIKGINRYLNFAINSGPDGYGIRDNNGVIEFKNDEGEWTALGSGGLQPGDNISELNNDAGYLTDLINRESLDITRDVNGYIEEVEYAGGRTITVSRTGNFITSKTDGVNTWTYNRDINNRIISVTVV